ncbi:MULTISPECIES: hypothetical protein [Streptomyces]|uniref:hypothetical protein n=1 Tax=Streptomyces TaxID=1883 RepID=UPI0032203F91
MCRGLPRPPRRPSSPTSWRACPVADWLDGVLRDLRSRIGDPSGTADPRFSPHLVPVFSTPEFVGPDARRDGRIRYVGPSIVNRPAGSDLPWD